LKGYASGEDGKAGIRGRLVSKQGSIIAKSLMAGFMSGAAEAFDVDPVPVLQTSNSGETAQYQSNYDPKLVQGAVSQGASSAMERIAEFYIEMAEGMYPVIEISAGRQIDVIVTSGAQLKI
jgi:conjugal transfer pilus assembly protein TraB